jgi:hypothetical protein
MNDSEYRGYKDGEQFRLFTLEAVKTLTAWACTNYGDKVYLRGLANGSDMPAKQLAELKTDKPDWWDSFESSAVDLLKGAQLMRIKDSAKREKRYDQIRADASITYEDVKAMVKEDNRRKPRAKRATLAEWCVDLLVKWVDKINDSKTLIDEAAGIKNCVDDLVKIPEIEVALATRETRNERARQAAMKEREQELSEDAAAWAREKVGK